MRRTSIAVNTAPVSVEEYLGFAIVEDTHRYTASPAGWDGPELSADSLPLIRRRIWFWWHRVP